MAAITAEMVKNLREKTGAGMMECKKALNDANGNEEQAIEALRKAGLASAKKREGRIAAEGAVGSYIHLGGKVGVAPRLMEQPFVKDQAITIGELVTNLTAKTGEKCTIRRFTRYKMGEGLERRSDDFAAEVAAMTK